MSTCWKVWHGGRDPPAETEKAFRRLREKVSTPGKGTTTRSWSSLSQGGDKPFFLASFFVHPCGK